MTYFRLVTLGVKCSGSGVPEPKGCVSVRTHAEGEKLCSSGHAGLHRRTAPPLATRPLNSRPGGSGSSTPWSSLPGGFPPVVTALVDQAVKVEGISFIPSSLDPLKDSACHLGLGSSLTRGLCLSREKSFPVSIYLPSYSLWQAHSNPKLRG